MSKPDNGTDEKQEPIPTGLIVKTGSLSELLPKAVRTSPLDDQILNLARYLTQSEKDWALLEETIKYTTWATAIRRLKNSKRLPGTWNIERHGKQFYFVNRATRNNFRN